jgi:hypothetical protein
MKIPEPPKKQEMKTPETPKQQLPIKPVEPQTPYIVSEPVTDKSESGSATTELEMILEDVIRGKVRGNIAMFQQPLSFAKSPSGGNIVMAAEDAETMKGKVVESKKAYIQRASSSDREDGSKQQRTMELEAMLRARNESGSGHVTADDPEKLFAQRQREERARELEEVAQLRATTIAHNMWEETDAHERSESSRLQRARELQELANLRQKKNWNEVVASGNTHDEVAFFCGGEDNTFRETEKQRRARELQELTSSRSKKSWDEAVVITEEDQRLSTKTPDPELELDEARSSIRYFSLILTDHN